MSEITRNLAALLRGRTTPVETAATQGVGDVFYGTIINGGLLIDDSADGTLLPGPFQTLVPYDEGARVGFILKGNRPLIIAIEGGFAATDAWAGIESQAETTSEEAARIRAAFEEFVPEDESRWDDLHETLETHVQNLADAVEELGRGIDDAAASVVTDARLSEASLSVWPFVNGTVPGGALAPGSVGPGEIQDFAITATKLKSTRHILY